MTVVFVCVTMLWIFFKLPNFDHAARLSHGHVCPEHQSRTRPKLFYSLALLYSLPVMIQHLGFRALFEGRLRCGGAVISTASMAALMYLEAGPETSFIYFQF